MFSFPRGSIDSVGSEWDSELGSLPPSPEDFSEEDDIHLINGATSAPLEEKVSLEESVFHSLPSLPNNNKLQSLSKRSSVDSDMVKFILKPPSRRSSFAVPPGEVGVFRIAQIVS